MKNSLIIILFILVFIIPQFGVELDVGLMFGSRTVSESNIKNIYGNGSEFNLYLDAKVWKGLTIGATLGTGYSESGKIGLYNEDTTLKMRGFDLFFAWQFKINKLVPYLKTGISKIKYEQNTESEFATDINESKSTMFFAGGLKFYPANKFFVNIEIKYVPLKVTPMDEKVDLSGMNLLAGIGITF